MNAVFSFITPSDQERDAATKGPLGCLTAESDDLIMQQIGQLNESGRSRRSITFVGVRDRF